MQHVSLNLYYTQAKVNGVVSFNGPLAAGTSPQFPFNNRFVLAPFWTEPAELTATIQYEVFDTNTVGTDSNYLMLVNNYIMTRFNTMTFNGSLLVIIRWSNIQFSTTDSVSCIQPLSCSLMMFLFAALISDSTSD